MSGRVGIGVEEIGRAQVTIAFGVVTRADAGGFDLHVDGGEAGVGFVVVNRTGELLKTAARVEIIIWRTLKVTSEWDGSIFQDMTVSPCFVLWLV